MAAKENKDRKVARSFCVPCVLLWLLFFLFALNSGRPVLLVQDAKLGYKTARSKTSLWLTGRARGGMADTPDLGSGAVRRGGSSPLVRTI